jgi:Dolichyl-phosphate-mannose-protein mannosyltransferase
MAKKKVSQKQNNVAQAAPAVDDARNLTFALSLLSAVLYALRLNATRTVGFGDSEALYACYAMHPAAAYLDHPGLIGVIARLIGSGSAPTPEAAHTITSLLATAVPWIANGTARALGATRRGGALCGLVLLAAPEMAIGLFAMTPDLPLAIGWLTALACAGAALRSDPKSFRAAACFLTAGLVAGIASTAKISGLLLLAALAWTYASNEKTRRERWPWAGIALGLFAFSPVVLFEFHNRFPMLQHRLVDTQVGAGLSLVNLLKLVFGQLGYLSPLFVAAAIWIFIDLKNRRNEDDVTKLLWRVTLLPLAGLAPLVLVSRVAEPHWIAPALLGLPLHYARNPMHITRITSKFARISMGIALAMVFFVHAWVLSPALVRYAPKSLDPKYDIANELFGWPDAVSSARELIGDQSSIEARLDPIVVVGPHWIVCAQLAAAMGSAQPVGCMTPVRDDFDDWQPRSTWENADTILFVTDNRFDEDLGKMFPDRTVAKRSHTTVLRGGRIARTFSLVLLQRRAQG